MELGEDQSYQEFFDRLRSNAGPSNLRQIFEDDDKPLQTESSSLRYKPLKPQKKPQLGTHSSERTNSLAAEQGTVPTAVQEQWTTVIAKVAHGYRGSDNVGRVGVALTKNAEGTAAKVIVYKTKSQVLCSLLLTPCSAQPNVILRESYMQFYDDEQLFWSVRFQEPRDEQEFVKVMLKENLPLEQEKSHINSSDQLKKLSMVSLPPQPQPRAHIRPRSDSPKEELPQNQEDIIITPVPVLKSNALVPLRPSSSQSSKAKASIVASTEVDQLNLYIDQQRATGQVMEKKMDSILQAMSRLGSTDHCCSSTSSATITQQDNEDELLELEQKLLNFKKENRALMKSLKAKEQALDDLRSSTCALCEELLAQNNDLKQQNSALLAAMKNQVQLSHAADSCLHCEQSSAKITSLERRISTLQNALLQSKSRGEE